MTQVAGDNSDPREFFRLLWRRKWILLACVILIPLATYVVSTRLTKTYEASTVLQLESPGVGTSVGDLVGGGSDTQTIERVAALIETNGVADQAAKVLDEPEGSLRDNAQATADEDTGFITVVAEGSSAQRSADVANAFADAVRDARTEQGRRRVDAAIATVEGQLEELSGDDDLARDELEGQLQGLRALRATQDQNLEVIEAAVPPGSPAAPNPARNASFALVLALLLGAALVALLDRLDRRVHDPEDLESLTGAPLLVRVPPEAFGSTTAEGDVAVAFQMLRDSLMFFNVDKRLDTLIVVSSLKGEGKTTVAANLAMAYARARKRVILVDADLRSPELGPRLGIDRNPGLSHMLSGEHEVEDVIRELEPFGSYLRVIPGGAPPPNPSELLTSKRMASLLEQLRAESDLVIIDTPPLLLVSDAFGLLEQATGAVAVVRLEQTPKDAVSRMAKVVATVQTRLLGVVATGGTTPTAGASGYGYGYGYGYGEQPRPVEMAPAAILTPSEGHADPESPNGGTPPPGSDGDASPGRSKRLFRSS